MEERQGDMRVPSDHNDKHGICVGEQVWKPEIGLPAYKIDNLIPKLALNPFEQLQKTLEAYGVWISALVLILEGVKFGIFLVMIAITALQEGALGALGLLVQIWSCNAMQSYCRIQRNRRRWEERHGGGPLKGNHQGASVKSMAEAPFLNGENQQPSWTCWCV